MNNRKTRNQARKILEDALRKIQQLDVNFNIICSTMFFNKNNEVTNESRLYCTGSENESSSETFKVHAECVLQEINDENESIRKTNKQNFKFLSIFGE
jgi:hypothetical protein